jgi:basic membrane lipoprotein Med (substrate-binding protein (PBP1-ABC) superfamily)
MFELMVNDVANDTFMPGKIYRPGVPEGIVTVGLNPDYGKEIPQEVMEQYEQAQADIESGTFEVPFIPEG